MGIHPVIHSARGGHPHGARPLGSDLLKEARNGSAVGTLVERTTRLVILAGMKGTDATSARRGFTKKLQYVPALLRKTLTYERGKEMAEHERLAARLAIRVDVWYGVPGKEANEKVHVRLNIIMARGANCS